MDRALILALSGLIFTVTARADLQLTPKEVEYQLDGAKLKQLVFMDGAQQVTYMPPQGWDYSGHPDVFVLHPSHGGRGEAVITRTRLQRPESFDENTIKRLTEEAISYLPRGATNVAVVSREKSPLMIERKETFLLIINYEVYGEPCARSVMFLNRASERLQFQLTAPRSNFPALQKAFQTSHFSWQNL